jgi:hypothetical protein
VVYDLFVNIFLKMRGPAIIFLSVQGLRPIYSKLRASLQTSWEYHFPELFSNGKIRGPGPRHCGPVVRLGSMVDRRQRFTGVRCPSVWGHRCLSVMAGEDEADLARPMVCSLEHERRR